MPDTPDQHEFDLPRPPTKEPEGGVTFPTALAMRLMDCYFGGGPRHREREARPIEPAPTTPDPGRLPPTSSRVHVGQHPTSGWRPVKQTHPGGGAPDA